jgi:hypothetical protein
MDNQEKFGRFIDFFLFFSFLLFMYYSIFLFLSYQKVTLISSYLHFFFFSTVSYADKGDIDVKE